MDASPELLNIPAAITRPSFWLYVLRAITDTGSEALYVGRTGDNAHPTANPPIFRMGQHFEPNGGGNMLLRRLKEHNIDPYTCTNFQWIGYGPLFPQTKNKQEHFKRRNVVAALENALHDALLLGGYNVIDHSSSTEPLCKLCWQKVRQAFKQHFGSIALYPHETQRPNHVCHKHS